MHHNILIFALAMLLLRFSAECRGKRWGLGQCLPWMGPLQSEDQSFVLVHSRYAPPPYPSRIQG